MTRNYEEKLSAEIIRRNYDLVQGEHFKLSRSLLYYYSLTKTLTENLKTVLELWGKGLQKSTLGHMTRAKS